MTKPIGLQLYSIREDLANDFEGSLRRVAELGFAGVEFAGIYGTSPKDAAALAAELGLKIFSAHMPPAIGDNQESTLANAAALGIDTVVVPWLPADRFSTLERVKAVCDDVNAAYDNVSAQGLRLAYHNHDFEFTPLPDGTLPFEIMRQELNPNILFEIDGYWVKFAGQDPAALIADLGARVPILHAKDGSGVAGEAMLAAGDGIIDFKAVIGAGGDNLEWLVVELDNCDTDMWEAVEKSFNYLVAQGFGHGR